VISRNYLAQGPAGPFGAGERRGLAGSPPAPLPRELGARLSRQLWFTLTATRMSTELLLLCSRHVHLHLLEVKMQEEKAIVRL